ncbi:hypothetical protein KIN20_030212 [Parelaphostrongylus tenuis]|uniref:Uncharacterized protein n=1 Tax=Parelaphostrongylus tenuis TaxID=148309 RepID=A0AAD5R3D7_PARTN|nr:hypothetical protein KIN20_030212 [Parelaphostrongylus tenuis]
MDDLVTQVTLTGASHALLQELIMVGRLEIMIGIDRTLCLLKYHLGSWFLLETYLKELASDPMRFQLAARYEQVSSGDMRLTSQVYIYV